MFVFWSIVLRGLRIHPHRCRFSRSVSARVHAFYRNCINTAGLFVANLRAQRQRKLTGDLDVVREIAVARPIIRFAARHRNDFEDRMRIARIGSGNAHRY